MRCIEFPGFFGTAEASGSESSVITKFAVASSSPDLLCIFPFSTSVNKSGNLPPQTDLQNLPFLLIYVVWTWSEAHLGFSQGLISVFLLFDTSDEDVSLCVGSSVTVLLLQCSAIFNVLKLWICGADTVGVKLNFYWREPTHHPIWLLEFHVSYTDRGCCVLHKHLWAAVSCCSGLVALWVSLTREKRPQSSLWHVGSLRFKHTVKSSCTFSFNQFTSMWLLSSSTQLLHGVSLKSKCSSKCCSTCLLCVFLYPSWFRSFVKCYLFSLVSRDFVWVHFLWCVLQKLPSLPATNYAILYTNVAG